MKIYDGFETKKAAKSMQRQLKNDKKYPVQSVQVRKGSGRLKWLVYVGGKNSKYW